MCNEREKLIGYLYDEVDANERRSVEAHLATCDTCREELSGFRAVRQDLLAWDVPAHESVWKPFVTARPQPVWWQMPAWSLAAAAMLVFAIGGAGGFAGRALAARNETPVQTQTAAAQAQPARVEPAASAVSIDELRAMQTRLVALERAAAARTVSAAPVSMSASSDAATLARIEQLIRESEGRSNKRLSQQILNIVGELNSQRLVDRATFDQKLNDQQAQINGTILRAINSRSPEREQ